MRQVRAKYFLKAYQEIRHVHNPSIISRVRETCLFETSQQLSIMLQLMLLFERACSTSPNVVVLDCGLPMIVGRLTISLPLVVMMTNVLEIGVGHDLSLLSAVLIRWSYM